jgi:hypothetical protein
VFFDKNRTMGNVQKHNISTQIFGTFSRTTTAQIHNFCIGTEPLSKKQITLKIDYSFAISFSVHNLYSSPSIIRMIKSRRMRWTGHVARMGEKRNACRYWWETQKERDHWEDQDVGGWTIINGS